MTYDLPTLSLRLQGGLNAREATVRTRDGRQVPVVRMARQRKERAAVQQAWMVARMHRVTVELPAVVTITRVGPGHADDDNLNGMAKTVRDEVARLIGINDGDHRIAWLYRQERGPYGVKVSIQTKARALTVVEEEAHT